MVCILIQLLNLHLLLVYLLTKIYAINVNNTILEVSHCISLHFTFFHHCNTFLNTKTVQDVIRKLIKIVECH